MYLLDKDKYKSFVNWETNNTQTLYLNFHYFH